jgi:hypothetical protein
MFGGASASVTATAARVSNAYMELDETTFNCISCPRGPDLDPISALNGMFAASST